MTNSYLSGIRFFDPTDYVLYEIIFTKQATLSSENMVSTGFLTLELGLLWFAFYIKVRKKSILDCLVDKTDIKYPLRW